MTPPDASASPSGGLAAIAGDVRRFSVPVFATPPDVVYNGATWPMQPVDTAKYYNCSIFNTSHAQNDGAAWWTPNFAPGVWRLDLLGGVNTIQPIVTIDISFDGGTTWIALGTVDQYAAGPGAAVKSLPGLTIPRSGPALVRFRALTKNALSTDWYVVLTSMEWTRTG